MTAPSLSTLELLEEALDRLDQDGPTLCAAHLSHAVEILRKHVTDRPHALMPLENS